MASNEEVKNETMRQFSTGATRNADTERIDPEGFLSYRPLEAYFDYMHKNRFQKDGNIRDSDNWQLGIPQRAYGKSLWRHFFDFWKTHRLTGNNKAESSPYRNERLIEDGVAIMFNIMGYLDVELQKPTKEEAIQKKRDWMREQESERRYALERNAWPVGGLLLPDGAKKNPQRYDFVGEGFQLRDRVKFGTVRSQLLEDAAQPEEEDGYGSGV